jgi:hypothetical protein
MPPTAKAECDLLHASPSAFLAIGFAAEGGDNAGLSCSVMG